MRKRIIVPGVLLIAFIAIVLTTLSPPFVSSAVQDQEWYAFGKDQYRTRNSTDQETTPPLTYKWRLDGLGWSISQPVMDDKFIYHIAGGYLYKIPLDLDFYDYNAPLDKIMADILAKGGQRIRISQNYNVRSHPTFDPIYWTWKPRIYAGTGDGKVVLVNLEQNRMKITRVYNAGVQIVNAPTVLGDDFITFGGSDARIYVFKGPVGYRLRFNPDNHPKAVITGTYSVLPSSGGDPVFIVPVNYTGTDKAGYVGAFQATDNGAGKEPSVKRLWYFKTDNGVAASITYDERKDRIYFADKSGTVYALDATNGKLVWKNTAFRTNSAATTLVNNSPALKGDTVVIPYRYHKGRGKGLIAAFNTDNGHVRWAVTSAGEPYSSGKYDGEIANAPTIMNAEGGKSVVLFGTTMGYLRTVNINTGKPEIIAYDNHGKTPTPMYYIKAVEGKGDSYYQGRGLATEIMVGGSHIVFGANDADTPNSRGNNGTLYAYSTKMLERPDLAALNMRVNPTKPIVGDELNLQVEVTSLKDYNWKDPVTTRLSWKANYSETYTTDPFTLNPGQRRWIEGLRLPAIPSSDQANVELWTKINPNEKEPANEITYENNEIKKTIPLFCGNDFYIKSIEGGVYSEGQQVTTKIVVGRNKIGQKDMTVDFQVVISGPGIPLSYYKIYDKPVTLAPGEEKPIFVTWKAEYDAGSYMIHAAINPNLNLCESDFTNNFMSTGVTIKEKLSPPMCKLGETKTSGISDMWEHCVEDEDGNVDCHYHYEYEYLSAEIVGPEATYVKKGTPYNELEPILEKTGAGKRVKAGQGFTFTVNSTYTDESGKYDGPLTAYAEFADGTRVELEPQKSRGSWTNTWVLPRAWVALRGDEVLYQSNDPGADWITGGRAHYTSQYAPDGGYGFKVVVKDAGKNNLSICLEDEVIIGGSIWDDFYVRRVNPERPFAHRDGVPTPMWEGKEHIFESLVPWWRGEKPLPPDDQWID